VDFESLFLLPQTITLAGAVLFIAAGRAARLKPLWGPACLIVLVLAAACLARQSAALPEQSPHSAAAPEANADASESHGLSSTAAWCAVTPFSVMLQWAGLAMGLLFALAAFDVHKNSNAAAEVFGTLLLGVTGFLLAAVANDLVLVYAAVELAGLPAAFLLLRTQSQSDDRNAAVQHVAMCLLSSALLLYGLSLLYVYTGTTNLGEMRAALLPSGDESEMVQAAPSMLGVTALVMLFAGLGYRIAAAPFHFGLPEVIERAAPWNAGSLAVLVQGTGFIILVRVSIDALPGLEGTGQLLALVAALASMTVGSAMALVQTNVQRMLGYLIVAHAGFALIPLAAGYWDGAASSSRFVATADLPGGVESCLFYLGSCGLALAGLFAVLVYLGRARRRIEYVEDLAGLVSREPAAAAFATICLLSLAGIPPLPGFWGRLFVFASALSVHLEPERGYLPPPSPAFVLLSLAAVAYLVITGAVYLRVVVVALFEGQVARPEPAGGQPALGAAVLAGMLTLGAGLLPGPLLGHLDRASAARLPAGAPISPAGSAADRSGAEIRGDVPEIRAERVVQSASER